MTEALRELWGTCWWFKSGLILISCWLQALPTPQSTSALCSCFCSRVGQANMSQPKHQPPSYLCSWTTWACLSARWGWAEPVGRAAADIAQRHSELPEQLQLGDGGGLCFMSPSCHTTLGPPWQTEGCHPWAGERKEQLPWASLFSLRSSAHIFSTKTHFFFSFLVRVKKFPS